jgi:hypothetical protein
LATLSAVHQLVSPPMEETQKMVSRATDCRFIQADPMKIQEVIDCILRGLGPVPDAVETRLKVPTKPAKAVRWVESTNLETMLKVPTKTAKAVRWVESTNQRLG